jgi:hypothetical protein
MLKSTQLVQQCVSASKQTKTKLAGPYLVAGSAVFTSFGDTSVLPQVAQMHTEHVTEMPEFHASLVHTAKPECRLGGSVVHVLQLGVGPQDIQDSPVRFPKELERWQEHGGVTL